MALYSSTFSRSVIFTTCYFMDYGGLSRELYCVIKTLNVLKELKIALLFRISPGIPEAFCNNFSKYAIPRNIVKLTMLKVYSISLYQAELNSNFITFHTF